jgi:hypothetical protein
MVLAGRRYSAWSQEIQCQFEDSCTAAARSLNTDPLALHIRRIGSQIGRGLEGARGPAPVADKRKCRAHHQMR